jgi:hypothetical protein
VTSTPGSLHADPSDEESRGAWRAALIACALAVAAQAGFASLSDPDLPNHLSIGEWIVAHHAVMYTEPFAWTRAGAPFYAYSWLVDLVMYAALRSAGPLGLHLLAALTGAAVVIAAAAAARALGARWIATVGFGVASAMVALESTPFVRPQLVMHLLVPLAWVCVARIRRHEGPSVRSLAALLVISGIAANTHITFPVVAAPLVLLLFDDDALRSRRTWLAIAAVLVGWLLSPYGLAWVQVFRLNFESNAITKPPAPTGELTPGFLVAPLYGLVLASLPLLTWTRIHRSKERMLLGALWLAGLFVFARIFKGLGPWWWCATPLTVLALERLPEASSVATRRAFALLLVAFVSALAIPNVRLYTMLARYEGTVSQRTLPSVKAYAAEPAARWLERNMRIGASGRVLTVFNYGSYLQWRLPSLSMSIDGRTIFPDSAALPDAIAERGVAYLGPWHSADLAVVPLTYPVAAKLDADSGWIRIGTAVSPPWAPEVPRAALWVRRDWWSRAGKPGSTPAVTDSLR